ncbi:TPA: hypothetical protein BOS_4243 [Bos taurus]|nr:TPA: hypothetical protein BOS_4243 [Bos taurus]
MQDLSCSRKPVPASAIFRRCSLLPRLSVSAGMIHRPGGAARAAAAAEARAPPEAARDSGAAGNRARASGAWPFFPSLITNSLKAPTSGFRGRITWLLPFTF